jgi:hypothetical protein
MHRTRGCKEGSRAVDHRRGRLAGWHQQSERSSSTTSSIRTATRPFGMAYIPQFGVCSYDVRTEQDIRGHGFDGAVWLDGDTGERRKVFSPRGDHTGNVISTVLWGLHYGDIRDVFAYRLFVFLFGFVLTTLASPASTSGGRSGRRSLLRNLAPANSPRRRRKHNDP